MGIFQQGVYILDSNEKLIEVQKVEFCKDVQGQPIFGSFQCLQVKKTDSIVSTETVSLASQKKLQQLKGKATLKKHTRTCTTQTISTTY